MSKVNMSKAAQFLLEAAPEKTIKAYVNANEIEDEVDSFQDKWTKAGISCSLFVKRGDIYLSQLEVPKSSRKEGLGTQFMKELIDLADKNKQTILLTPSKDLGATSVSRLEDFYRRFGFKNNKGRRKDYHYSDTMIRRYED